ncbi:MAG: Fic family protein [Bacteroidales bacterium]
MDKQESQIIELVRERQPLSSKEVFETISSPLSYATVKRMLVKLQVEGYLIRDGQGKATKYLLSPTYELLYPIDIDDYFTNEIDQRRIRDQFNHHLIPDVLGKYCVFTPDELIHLETLQDRYRQNFSRLSETQAKKELERLAIDLSWKSSQIEGNTYSLLETERLLMDKQTAAGKTKEEAVMLLNHKEAIDFIIANPDYLQPLSIPRIEDIHRLLVKELAIDTNLRTWRVGISGTNYRPLDNVFQIKEALTLMCDLINKKESAFEKALLLLVLISYIQPFVDGNKRTARIVSNAILINHQYCPISFRTVDSVEYKKSMLIFYEQNNLAHFKKIFIDQFEFAVNTYF